ncbi:MAG: diguanylate cyclase, partial [Dehalococcoidales bacterium]
MFQITSQSSIQFITLIIYFILVSVIILYGRAKLKHLYLLFLLTSAGWSLSSLVAHLEIPYQPLVFLKILVMLFATWSIIAYAHLLLTFARRDTGTAVKLGYGWLAFVLAATTLSVLTERSSPLGSLVVHQYAERVVSFLPVGNWLICGLVAFILIRSLKYTSDPEERNRLAYLLAGLGFMLGAGITWQFIPNNSFALEHIGQTGNALLILYTLLKYRLLDIQLVIRKWLVYTGITVCVTLAFFALLLVLGNLLRRLPVEVGVPATIGLVILFAWSFNWLKGILDKSASRLFYGKSYVYRQMLLDFARKMNNFIDMKEIAGALLPPMAKALSARQVSLLFAKNTHYTTNFASRLTEGEPTVSLKISEESNLIQHLKQSGRPISLEGIGTRPNFNWLSPEEKKAIGQAQIEVLCPIMRQQRLIGILALGNKHPPGRYSRDEMDFAAMLANEATVAIDNAQIYANAREKANTDELTDLYNHRYFHQRLDEEVTRCSGSDEFFSVLFIDLDCFKVYNDIYGHVPGDEILRETGQLLKDAIRNNDVAARYGGDEFAVILSQIPLDKARTAAEKIRRRLEVSMSSKGIPLTCSIGVASWLADGVTAKQIIETADNALLHAKQAGGNRICLARDAKTSRPGQPDTMLKAENNSAITSIVYALAATVDARDHYTYGHSMKVSEYATDIAQAMGYLRDGIERIRAAALLHDIGKLNMPDRLLMKTDPLTEEDWEAIKHHPILGANIMKHIVGLRGCIDGVLFHHERYDGRGYTKGLKGKDIPLDARILCVADSYDAMTSERHHKNTKFTEEEAIEELRRCSGSQFDPEIAAVFINLR